MLQVLPVPEITTVLGLASMAAGGMSAVLGCAIGRLTGDKRATWMAVALALYSVAGVPATAIGTTSEPEEAALGNVRLCVGVAVVGALVVAVSPGGLHERWKCRSVFVLGLLGAAVCALLGALLPQESLTLLGYSWLRVGIALLGVLVGLVVAAAGWASSSRFRSWVGLGFAMIALTHLDPMQVGLVAAPFGFSSSVIRLFGMLLVVAGLGQVALQALVAFSQRQSQQQQELLLAKQDLRKAAEQGHELRNGLAGLAGAAGLLVDRPDAVLNQAMASELARLNALLRADQDCPAAVRGEYSVVSVLRDQVALRRSAGMDVRLDADVRLSAEGSASTLAQVVANVLTNSAVHAPGSPVRVQASRRADRITIRISDFGPGVPQGAEVRVLEAGTRGARSPGQGLGLNICQRLLCGENGTISITARRGDAPGCTVRIEVQAAQVDDRARRVAASAQW
ncbi:MAG TPA: HAMP domain-containing sensor histidine kinase [Pseudonocardia sp.]|nr:HAMP domain-containing sensor histidine kinase [Pseudonocardia sp.]